MGIILYGIETLWMLSRTYSAIRHLTAKWCLLQKNNFLVEVGYIQKFICLIGGGVRRYLFFLH